MFSPQMTLLIRGILMFKKGVTGDGRASWSCLSSKAWKPVREIYRFPFSEGLSGDLKALKSALSGLGEFKRNFRADLYHLNCHAICAFYHYHSWSVAPAPNFFTLHFFPPTVGASNSLVRRVLERSNWINGVSRDVWEEANKISPEFQSRSSVIHNGLKMPTEAPSTLNFSEPKILCAGRVVYEKGFDLAFRAFALVLKQVPRAKLLLAGGGVEIANLRSLAVDLAIEKNVEFLGWICPADMPKTINQASIVLIPSRAREPFGLIAVEAAQMGRPVVAARNGGLAEIIIDGETGILVEIMDVESTARALLGLIGNPEKSERFGAAARQRAEQKFGIDRMLVEYESIYQKLT